MESLAPRFTVATENTPRPAGLRSTTPVLPMVAASATMSGTGLVEATSSNVLTPSSTGAGDVFVQLKIRRTSVGGSAVVGVKAMRKV